MTDLTLKRLLVIHVVIAVLSNALFAHGEAAEVAMSKVTIVVDGMMKSKSGAT